MSRSFTKNFIIVALFFFTFSCSTNEESGPAQITPKAKTLSFEATLKKINFNLNDPTEAYMDAALKFSNTLNSKLNSLSRPVRTKAMKRIEELANNPSADNSKELALLMGYNSEKEFILALNNLNKRKNNFLARNSKFNNLNIPQKKEFMSKSLLMKVYQANPALRIADDSNTAEDCEHEAAIEYAAATAWFLAECMLCADLLIIPPAAEACYAAATLHYAFEGASILYRETQCLAEVEEAEKKKKD